VTDWPGENRKGTRSVSERTPPLIRLDGLSPYRFGSGTMKKKKQGQVPDVIHCGGCKRPLVTKNYHGFSEASTPKDKIHYVHDPTSPSFSVACTCGHFTVSRPFAETEQ
jgi:hypothetical protein